MPTLATTACAVGQPYSLPPRSSGFTGSSARSIIANPAPAPPLFQPRAIVASREATVAANELREQRNHLQFVKALRGKYAHIPGTSEEFIAEKHANSELENANQSN